MEDLLLSYPPLLGRLFELRAAAPGPVVREGHAAASAHAALLAELVLGPGVVAVVAGHVPAPLTLLPLLQGAVC